jgi:hypothetical protein
MTDSNLKPVFLTNWAKRSCVRGRGGLISFSNPKEMDCASKFPITTGNLMMFLHVPITAHTLPIESGCMRSSND